MPMAFEMVMQRPAINVTITIYRNCNYFGKALQFQSRAMARACNGSDNGRMAKWQLYSGNSK